MNWVLIIVLLVLAICIISGYIKGALRMAYSLVSWIIVLAFVSWATPHVSLYLLENTSIHEQIETRCEETMRQSANEQIENAQSQKKAELTEQMEKEELLAELGVNIPDFLLEGILEKTTGATEDFLEESGAYTKVAESLANFVVEGIAFLLTLVTAWLLVHIISRMLGIVSRIPVIKGVNRLLGVVAGAIYGLLLVWLGFYVVALGSAGETGQIIVSYIYQSPFLIFLYENNFVLTMILKNF